jgi:hypothetical protein
MSDDGTGKILYVNSAGSGFGLGVPCIIVGMSDPGADG